MHNKSHNEHGERWRVTVSYYGPSIDDQESFVEELVELQDLIERGPDFRGIESIVVRYADNVVAVAA